MIPLTCLAQAHLVNPKTGKLGSGDEWMRGVLRVYTTRAEVIGSPWPFSAFFKSGEGVENISGSARKGAPSIRRARAGARSLRLPQRIITSFVRRRISLLLKRSSPTSSDAPKALGVRKSRQRNGWPQPLSQSAGSSSRLFVRFARNSSAGAL